MSEIKRGFVVLSDGTKELFPDGIQTLEGFSGREDIEQLYIPDSVITIENQAFLKCKNLKDVYINVKTSKLRFIGFEAFYFCQEMRSFQFPKSLVHIGNWAFAMTVVGRADLSETELSYLGRCAFIHDYGLTYVSLPYSINTISENCFSCCGNLRQVDAKARIEFIDGGAFDVCHSLTSVPKLALGAKVVEVHNENLIRVLNS